MSTRRRARKPNHRTFYCRYGQHYAIPLQFEKNEANQGICSHCALRVYDLLRDLMYMPELRSAQDHTKGRAEWQAAQARKAATERLRKGSTDPGWVYYVEQGGLIKIGYSADVKARIRAYGPTATLLAVHPGTQKLEHDVHQQFAKALARGREWFNPTEELRQHVDTVLERFGDPSVFAYEYTVPKTQEQRVRDSFEPRPYSVIAN